MSEAAQAVLTQALTLTVEDQRWLGEQLRDESEEIIEDESEIEGYAEWRDELDRRLQSVADGTANLVDADVAIARIRENLAKRRNP
jgi:hypothetical protein